ncbi:tRNA (adenosine(37)-N6)-threonylcarbamoyltransferase complex transferase subunit TsaD [Patescibacteria group bacterium]|nr:MAG: tRNA (adenosine(37)-N6)-threonylcarbamoyltransferase complex transferase subunit TsaD [Patescibacteria group bacterium]
MIILGIETSCDETAAAIVRVSGKKLTVLASVVSSQVALHAKWGGVVPNLAAREHLKNIQPVLSKTLSQAHLTPEKIDLIAVTHGPGLIPALLIGTNFAKAMAYTWKKPLLGIHHIEGHIYANFISENLELKTQHSKRKKIKFPVLALVVSGGHTQLILMKDHLQYKIIGQTLDDAAGEAFDKVARMLNVGYPGGPAVAKYAKRGTQNVERKTKNAMRYALCDMRLPRPMMNSKNFDFSFSGLKTAVLYLVKKIPKSELEKLKPKICAEFQQAVIDVLVSKTISAAKTHRPKTILLAGGVSANQELRKQLGEAIKNNLPKSTNYELPVTDYCMDNAAMISAAGFFRWNKMTAPKRKKLKDGWKTLQTSANFKLS